MQVPNCCRIVQPPLFDFDRPPSVKRHETSCALLAFHALKTRIKD